MKYKIAAALISLLCISRAQANTNTAERIAALEQVLAEASSELEALKSENGIETSRPVAASGPEHAEHGHPHARPDAVKPHKIPIPVEGWDWLSFNFLMELEGFASKSGDVSESDIVLAAVELGIDADVVDGVSAHLGLLWEEDDNEENILDEGYITFGSSESVPFYLTVGKMYLPFGNFESVFISDPLTLELAEINETAALGGYANEWIDINVGAFNGSFEEDRDDNTIDDFVASVTITPAEGLAFGACWLSDLFDVDGFEDFVSNALDAGNTYQEIDAAGAFLNAQAGPLAFSAEYIRALESSTWSGEQIRPSAYNIELSANIHERVAVGVRTGGSDEFYADVGADKWADEQYGAVISFAVNDHLTVSGEYLHEEGLDDDESGDMVTAQIALVL